MKDLVHQLGKKVMGVLSGFDRILFRGMLRSVVDVRGMNGYLYGAGVAMKDFKQHAQEVTKMVREESLRPAQEAGCEVKPILDSKTRKKDVALAIAQRDGIREGRICVLKATEPCRSFHVRRDRETKTIALEHRPRKCQHLYHYFLDARFGLMHVRLQTWFPFGIQICLNGREWLARQLDAAGIDYDRQENGISRVADLPAAQELLDSQLTVDWARVLDDLRREVHPAHETVFQNCPEHCRGYYWSVAESEWASDLLFRNPAHVLPVCERLVVQSMRVHGAGHVMRFLGRRVRKDGMPRVTFQGEIQSNVIEFEQGLRIKHRLNANSAKMYNHPGLLRFETTINNPGEFKVWRGTEKNPDAAPAWLRMRKGIADLHRRAQVSQASNDRFATAQAAVLDEGQRLKELAESVCRRVRRAGRKKPDGTQTQSRTYRALNPLSPDDVTLLTAVSRAEFVISGLRNRDLRRLLYGDDPQDAKEKRRRSSAVSRKLALLRAHGIVQKVSKSHQYRVTAKGRLRLTAVLAAANATTTELTQLAA